MWSFDWHLLCLASVWPYTVAGILSFAITCILGFIVWKHPRSESRVKHLLWAIPLLVFVACTLFGLVRAPYLADKEIQSKLTDIQGQLDRYLEDNRPTVHPVDFLPVEVLPDTQTQDARVYAHLSFINSGNRAAYHLRISIIFAPSLRLPEKQIMPEITLANPLYPQSQYKTDSTNPIVVPVSAPVEGQAILMYFSVQYFDADSDGHSFENEFWYTYSVGALELVGMTLDKKGEFEPIVRGVYANSP